MPVQTCIFSDNYITSLGNKVVQKGNVLHVSGLSSYYVQCLLKGLLVSVNLLC